MKTETQKEIPIFEPEIQVPLRDKSFILVTELAWPDALELFDKLKAQSAAFVTPEGNLTFDANRIIAAISQSVELTQWLVWKTTGKESDWMNQRTLSEILDVLVAAIEINLTVVAERAKKVRGRARALLPGAGAN
jgi:hypothetical protein